MNKEIKKYIKYVKKIIPFYSKDKKEFLKLLTQKIIEFSNTHPNFTYQNIIDEFGSPNEVAGSYIESLENDDIIKQLNKKYIFKTLVTIGKSGNHYVFLVPVNKELDLKNAKLMLSNSNPKNTNKEDNFFEDIYKGFNINEVSAKRMINSKAQGRGEISELLITNYKENNECIQENSILKMVVSN